MKPMLLVTASALAAWAGMVVLCFQSPNQRHRMGLGEQTDQQRFWFVAAGVALLGVSMAVTVATDGASFGLVLWLSQVSILGLILICWLPYSMVSVTKSSRVAAAIAPLLLAVGSWL
jgi:hypothetical protein